MKLKDFIKGKIISKQSDLKKCKGFCGICQIEGELNKGVISSNFNNREEMKSELVCDDCLPLFHEDFRKKSFYITEKKAETIKQNQIYDILHNIEPPCILSFTESNKKHRLFRSVITTKKTDVIITLDDGILSLDLTKDLKLLQEIQKFYTENKVSKTRILNGDFPLGSIKKIGFQKFIEFENKIKNLRGTRKLKYLIMFCVSDFNEEPKKLL